MSLLCLMCHDMIYGQRDGVMYQPLRSSYNLQAEVLFIWFKGHFGHEVSSITLVNMIHDVKVRVMFRVVNSWLTPG